jgi:predicted RNA-binding protein with PIN domain
MPIIIDGNNLIGSFPEISIEDPTSISKVIRLVKKFQEDKKNNVIIVFDGQPDGPAERGNSNQKFNIIYPRIGNTADDEIKAILDNMDYFKDVILVSSDRELKAYARDKGAKTINSIEFYYELKRFARVFWKKEESQKRINAQLSETEVDQWLKVFSDS